MNYLDPLYGQFEITAKQLKLFQTHALTRIRDISLSAVPPLATAFGSIGSRFEHSVGVGHLALHLTKNKEFKDFSKDIYLSCLFHDTGSPPFSHISEIFLEDLTGKNHEESVENIILNTNTTQAIKGFGGEVETVVKLITGNLKPWSDLVNGSIDLDNIDNSLRWGAACGIIDTQFYDPLELLHAFVIHEHQLALKESYSAHIQKWELCRRLIYDVVYSDLNMMPEAMLFRALQIAYDEGELGEEFFTLTDSQALYVLEHRFNTLTRKLITNMRHWQFYQPAYELTKTSLDSTNFKVICTNWRKRQEIADLIAREFHIPKECVAVYAGKDKGFKKIHLPFVGGKQLSEHEPIQKLYWRIKVYIHPDYQSLITNISHFVQPLAK